MITTPRAKTAARTSGQRTADSGHMSAVQPGRTARALRYIPPAAALGTAFVLQVVAVTDLLGTALADRFHTGWAYIPALLFGLSVAAGMEGGAAYLMDLYDKHLLARDNTWLLRASMVAYVAASAVGLHWWADHRGLPTVMSWLLAGMSASALFLWSRGSRWHNREAMRAAGQIDPALPRLPAGAKVLHPVRWLVTLWLISWNPAMTTAEARARYQAWQDRRSGRTARTEEYVQSMIDVAVESIAAVRMELVAEVEAMREAALAEVAERHAAAAGQVADLSASTEAKVAATLSAVQAQADSIRADAELYAATIRTAAEENAQAVRRTAENLYADAVRVQAEADSLKAAAERTADTSRPVRLVASNGQRRTANRTAAPVRGEVSVADLADTLDAAFRDRVPGRPAAMAKLREVYGSCSNERAREAISELSARRESQAADDEERVS